MSAPRVMRVETDAWRGADARRGAAARDVAAARPSGASPWRTFLRERAPLPLMLALGAGQALSSWALSRGPVRVAPLIVGTLGIAGLLVLLRLMDEVKDVAKDRVAHPERPLPRGLVRESIVRAVIGRAWWMACAVSLVALAGPMVRAVLGATDSNVSPVAAILSALRATPAAVAALAALAWAWLMYREFGAPRWLARSAFAYGMVHQLVLVPMYAFTLLAWTPDAAALARGAWWTAGGLGAGFAFEIARKLDPGALPVLGTYLVRHGRVPTFAALGVVLVLVVTTASGAGIAPFVWPVSALATLALIITLVRPAAHAHLARAAGALVVTQLLAPLLARAWEVLVA
ncbi:MAG: hypothetical protein HY275_04095 [Gemmatimonadetes bacterium]|nr:hypothetical protein [Gemmatimonadota bacterium]